MATAREYAVVDRQFLFQRVACRGLGLVSLSRRDRSAWRHQLLWPLFGLANQLLSVIALCLGTTLLIKMQKAKYLFVTLIPLAFMCVVTFSAGYLKVFSSDPRIGFLSGAQTLRSSADSMTDLSKAADAIRQASVWRLDAIVALAFLVLVFLIVAGCAREWWRLLRGTKRIVLHESEFVPVTQVAQSVA